MERGRSEGQNFLRLKEVQSLKKKKKKKKKLCRYTLGHYEGICLDVLKINMKTLQGIPFG
jgi:hypothetical protein